MLPPITIIGQRLKELRINAENTMEEEAAYLNQAFSLKITKSMMSRWESSQSQPSSMFLSAYAKYHNIDLNYIVGLTDIVSTLSKKLEINPVLPQTTAEEQELMKKYRVLSEEGKLAIKTTINSLYSSTIHSRMKTGTIK